MPVAMDGCCGMGKRRGFSRFVQDEPDVAYAPPFIPASGYQEDRRPPPFQEEEEEEPGCCARCCSVLSSCCTWGCCFLLLIFAIAEVSIATVAGRQFVQLHHRVEHNVTDGGYLRTPENLTDLMWVPDCFGGLGSELVSEMRKLNEEQEWKLVSFKSRRGSADQEVVTNTAWVLPINGQPQAPRIVVQHAIGVNFNDWTVQTMAYLIRSFGFAVLIPNLRDHGSSHHSRHRTVGWGWDYHLDTLGAWDYAVNDTDGAFGGNLSSDQVGLLGLSTGGFVASIALAQELSIPAAWVDSTVFDARAQFEFQIERALAKALGPLGGAAPYLAPWFLDASWLSARFTAGVDLSHRSPEVELDSVPWRSDRHRRPVAVVHGKLDESVPVVQSEALVRTLNRSTHTFVVREEYFPESRCGPASHLVSHLFAPNEYRSKLCVFWSQVFGRPRADCEVLNLPDLEEAANDTHPSS